MLKLDINLLFTAINLLIWYFLIRKFLFKPINQVIEKRKQAIDDRYEEAEKVKEDALAEKEKYEAMESGIQEEKAKVLQQAQEDARAEYDKIVAEANRRAGEILEDSQRKAQQEHTVMVSRAEREIRSLLFEAASDCVRNETDNAKIYDQFLEKAGEGTHADA